MPKNWFFDIYEDTEEEEAANLMEHSTLTLDLSSDEESSKSLKDDKGKENMPPEDYDAPTASRPAAEPAVAAPKRVKKTDLIRRKVESDKMDDGERSPLSDLETDSFIPEGLDKDSHIVVNPTPKRSTSTSINLDMNNLIGDKENAEAGKPPDPLQSNYDACGNIVLAFDHTQEIIRANSRISTILHSHEPGAMGAIAQGPANTSLSAGPLVVQTTDVLFFSINHI